MTRGCWGGLRVMTSLASDPLTTPTQAVGFVGIQE